MATIDAPVQSSSRTSTFTDPDLYRQAVRAAEAEIVVVGRGAFRGDLTRIDFERLWVQRGHDTLARVAWVRNNPARAPISFLTAFGQPPQIDSGTEVWPGDIVFHSPGANHHTRTLGEVRWGAMSLAPDDLAALGRAVLGRDLVAPSATSRLRPPPALMDRLLELHATAGRLAESTPEILAHPEVSRALEQGLLHVMARCLGEGMPVEGSSCQRRHAAALARFEEYLTENYDRPLYLTEICSAIAVSERSLRMCCQETIGMGPIQYLWLRRMNLARRALMRTAFGTVTVTEIATAHGFWELGRFAVAYRTLFGESPSQTLARPPQAPPERTRHMIAGIA